MSGETNIAPWQISDPSDKDPIIAIDAPRPDFQGAIVQFLIGLLQTALAPKDEEEWRRRFKTPPGSDELRAAFEPLRPFFEIDGGGPRFLQDLTLTEGVTQSINCLLIDTSGDQSLGDNKDHFVKRETVQQCCPRCTATALLTMQLNAPEGGRGHMTSIRGGGPLTTLILGETFWHTLWLNVLPRAQIEHLGNSDLDDDSSMFPWLALTRQSSEGRTTPRDAHPLQVYWGMPRRIRFECNQDREKGTCDLCGATQQPLVTEFINRHGGVAYSGGWVHPLTPYRIDKKTGEPIAVHPQPGGVTYRHWLGLIQTATETDKSQIRPALVVDYFRTIRQRHLPQYPARIWAAGYDMAHMKARGYYESVMPLRYVNQDIREEYEAVIAEMISTAKLIAQQTQRSVIDAWYGTERKSNKGRPKWVGEVGSRIWQDTEPLFFDHQETLLSVLSNDEEPIKVKESWLEVLRSEALALFDEYSQLAQIGISNPRRIAIAHRELTEFLRPETELIARTLGLPLPPKKKGKRTAKVRN